MRRRYRRDVFADRILMIREKIKNAGIGADVIVGFPGESESDFNDTLSFLEQMPLSYLHVFTFSERPGTAAAELSGKVSNAEKTIRSKQLITLSEKKHQEFCSINTGLEADVLFEKHKADGLITGFTGNYIKTVHPWQSELAGKIFKVRLAGLAQGGRMTAEIIR
jgi:threonylcarbamoyladenosine tRNA methylthiotransferase MtaB